jgi:hypothetical protein
MAVQAITLAAYVVAAMACGVWSTVILWKMVDEVNVHLPESQRFTLLGWHPLKYRRLLREYRRLCPAGKGVARLRYLWLAMVLSMSLAALAVGGVGAAAFVGLAGCAMGWLWCKR